LLGDFNGDDAAEVAAYRRGNSRWYLFSHPKGIAFGRPGDVPVPGDYNADGRTELAVYRPATGQWFVRGGPSLRLGGRGYTPIPPPAHAL
jgi:hypothetical protein